MSKMISYKIVSGYKKNCIERKIRNIEHQIESRERYWKSNESSRVFWSYVNKGNAESTHATMMAQLGYDLEMWRKEISIEEKVMKYSSEGLSLQGAAVPLPLRKELFHRYEQTMVKYA